MNMPTNIPATATHWNTINHMFYRLCDDGNMEYTTHKGAAYWKAGSHISTYTHLVRIVPTKPAELAPVFDAIKIRDQINNNIAEIGRLTTANIELVASLKAEGFSLLSLQPQPQRGFEVGDLVKVIEVEPGSGACLGAVYNVTAVDDSDTARSYKLADMYWPLNKNIEFV